MATWAVPAGLIGARLYSVVTDSELYFRPGRDWIDIFRVWDGGIGMPGAVVAGVFGAWLGCRRAGVRFGPVAGAAAPAAAIGQAIGRWGNWFNQELYGRPSGLPWAVGIDPAHRGIPYENSPPTSPRSSTNRCGAWPWVSRWSGRRGPLPLAGDRVLALYLAGYATGSFAVQSLRIDFAHHLLGLRTDQWAMIAVWVAAVDVPDHDEREAGGRTCSSGGSLRHPLVSRGLLPERPGHIQGTILTKRMFPASQVFREPHEAGKIALVA